MLADDFGHAGISSEIFYPGATGQKEEIKGAALDGGKCAVGVDGDVAATGGMAIFIERCDGDIDLSPTQ